MADYLTHRIIEHIRDRRYVPRQVRQLAQDLGVDEDEYEAFRQNIQNMIDQGRVVLGASDTIGLPPPGRRIIGTFRRNPRGFGFVVPEDPTEHGDLFVPQGNTGGALTGDVIRAKVIHAQHRARRGRSPYVGSVIDILQRADRHHVGNLVKREGQWIVIVDGRHFHHPIVVRDPHAKDAVAGDKVVVELVAYPTDDEELAEGVIVEVLGKQDQTDVETRAVMRAYGLPETFTGKILDEARAIARQFNPERTSERETLDHQLICTIDPPDARDYDDAIHVERIESDKDDAAYELGVHIADVSNFVQPNSTLDQEAFNRGNSTYLPRKVNPMLPEILSNGLCSLQEGVVRFCKSAFIRYDADGTVVSERFANTVITSAKRMTYREAQALIEDDLKEARRQTKSEPKYSRKLISTVKLMDELARVIRRRRQKQGMISLDLPKAELVFDDAGNVVDAVPEDNAFTHTIIEMFMVESNEAVARLFDRLDVPIIRRIHPDPPSHDMKDLRQFARIAGYNIPLHPSHTELQNLLDAVRGKPAQHAVHLAVLQTLSRAEYAPLHIGHFALASEHYTHFTSPIRRYPDLLVHRALDAYLDHSTRRAKGGGRHKSKLAKSLRDDDRVPDEPALVDLGRHCSQTERNAEAAEHDLTNYLVLKLLSNRLGEDFDGTVTGITSTGLFLQLDRLLVDGFVHINDLPTGQWGDWRFNQNTAALVASRSAQTITIGDRFTVRISNVNPHARRLDLVIIDEKSWSKSKKRHQPAGARKAHQQTMKIKRAKKKRGNKAKP